jgi:hypothetical protein
MEPWRVAWRKGFVPSLTRAHLEALRKGLADADPRLVRKATTVPSCWTTLFKKKDTRLEKACAVAYCGWQAEGLDTVAKAVGFFDRVCLAARSRLADEGTDYQDFFKFIDHAPWNAVVEGLLAEVDLALSPA